MTIAEGEAPPSVTLLALPRRNGRIVAVSVHVTLFGKPLVIYASQQLGVRVGNYCGTERHVEVPNWMELSLTELRDAVERQLKPGDL